MKILSLQLPDSAAQISAFKAAQEALYFCKAAYTFWNENSSTPGATQRPNHLAGWPTLSQPINPLAEWADKPDARTQDRSNEAPYAIAQRAVNINGKLLYRKGGYVGAPFAEYEIYTLTGGALFAAIIKQQIYITKKTNIEEDF